MNRGRFGEEQIAFALRQAETGTPVAEVIRRMGISEQTFYRWKKRYAGIGMAALRRMKQVERREPEAETTGGRPVAGQGNAAGRDPPEVKSSTMTRMRNRRLPVKASAAKSSDQRWSGRCGSAIGGCRRLFGRTPEDIAPYAKEPLSYVEDGRTDKVMVGRGKVEQT